MKRTNAKTFHHIPLSVLDLIPVSEGSDIPTALYHSIDLAQHAERWGFNRYWIAEHHNNPGIASSATSVVMGQIGQATNEIRIGSGGIMLPNHAALVIAEQFGTLEALFPGRIDLGLGRAPGTDQVTAYALRRTLNQRVEDFPLQVEELESYFKGESRVRAIPGEGANIPIWLLGSSDFSARLAALKGKPFSFASHFSPDYTLPALRSYREQFEPSAALSKPYAMLGLNIIAAESDEKAQWLATTQKQMLIALRSGMPTTLKPPIGEIADFSPVEPSKENEIRSSIIGGPDTVKRELEKFIELTAADELIITSQIYDQQERLRSYEIIAALMA
ncbi:LLM class flavin-dependent oxidoreductase [Virgibacillus soli]|uniref:LLM class flavin-dependent oxidoreductase n=1 Tax=Paracerasibacillus soli TaxID=480284 RepID=A0ABU5CTB5_9BACI|nr:LLM class flavin-dependent oxidoreductase [Virgibacillus soli]MDY0409627.1 LLM class flavin-dependent oxidoreductase [Virgibacillus soli]